MPTVFIPSLLRNLTGGRDSVTVEGVTIREIIDSLETIYPGIRARLLDGPELRRGIAVAIGPQLANLGLAQPVPADAEVHFVPAISGG